MVDETRAVEWHGAMLPREQLNPEYVRARDALADAAKAGDWPAVKAVLDGHDPFVPGVNDWRVGGQSWFAPLHQAAWLGAPLTVVQDLIERGAWRSLKDSQGKRPIDIARERGHSHLIDELTPRCSTITLERAESMGARLAEVVDTTVFELLSNEVPVRHLPVEGLAESSGVRAWFPIPGMYGGFAVEFYKSRLHVESWCRVVGGSGRAWVITADRTTLVDEGFV